MCGLNNLSGCELVALASIVSIWISEGLSAEDTGLLGSFFSSIGDNLATIAATKPTGDNNTCDIN